MPTIKSPLELFDIPRLNHIRIDGCSEDWREQGLRVEILSTAAGQIKAASDFDARFRLGWNDLGLLLLVCVQDDLPVESGDDHQLWTCDSVEVFVSAGPGSPERYQAVISPGLDPRHPSLRTQLLDLRPGGSSREPLRIEAAVSPIAGGYQLEALLPWSNPGDIGRQGDEIGFQIYVNDTDRPGERFQVAWYPSHSTHADPSAMYRLRLADRPSIIFPAVVRAGYEQFRRVRVDVISTRDRAGKPVELRAGDIILGRGELAPVEGRSTAVARFLLPAPGQPSPLVDVMVGGETVAHLGLEDLEEQRARALLHEEIHLHPPVFSGPEFPTAEAARPLLLEEITGPYTIKTTYYDADYNPVLSAPEAGRYGAVVEVTPENGRPLRRFRTLYRTGSPLGWRWRLSTPEIAMPLAPELGLDPAIASEQGGSVSAFAADQFYQSLGRDHSAAVLLAGLHETPVGSPRAGFAEDPAARDRQWWVGLKRKLYGADQANNQPIQRPSVIQGTPAEELREGSPEEAGFDPRALERLEAVCQEWEENSEEPFAACVARHGVVFYYKPFDRINGEPMTLTTKTWMASITKLLCGSLMMMLVDQDLLGLDDPVEKYLPAFQEARTSRPITIRHLYTHTAGLWDHWGDELHDFEELMAGYAPYLKVGEQHNYNGASYAVAGKIIEMVSGEALPQFYNRHLLQPLGCDHTVVRSTSWDAVSIPIEMARFGQMLLNKGAYGRWRFFSEETFQQMLPVSLMPILGPQTQMEWGIGATWFRGEGLGEHTFGHGAASAATLRIDPDHDLVVVMTRNAAGANFNQYHPLFMRAIAEGLT